MIFHETIQRSYGGPPGGILRILHLPLASAKEEAPEEKIGDRDSRAIKMILIKISI